MKPWIASENETGVKQKLEMLILIIPYISLYTIFDNIKISSVLLYLPDILNPRIYYCKLEYNFYYAYNFLSINENFYFIA